MRRLDLKSLTFNRDLGNILDIIDDCVFIIDENGCFVVYNRANGRIDNLDPVDVIGKHITDIYNLNQETSITLQVLQTQKAIVNVYQEYEVICGRKVTSISSAYPIFTNDILAGAIIISKDMNFFKTMLFDYSKKNVKEIVSEKAIGSRYTFENIIGDSPKIKSSIETAIKAAQTNSSVLVYGETGTGKEMVVQSIHNASNPDGPFIPLNCAAIPENLLEGLLFGTTRGAFTGSLDHVGLFEKASGGTLYLDELNSMNLNLQAKLLRVIEEGKVMRLGESKERIIDTRFMSSLSENPLDAVVNNKLRQDLFYRLGVVIIKLPSLAERREDIVVLLNYFIEKFNNIFKKNIKKVSNELMELLLHYDWPGNVRELEHVVESAMNMIGNEQIIEKRHLSTFTLDQIIRRQQNDGDKSYKHSSEDEFPKSLKSSVEQLECKIIIETLRKTGGNISSAADLLGTNRQNLHYKIRKYNIDH